MEGKAVVWGDFLENWNEYVKILTRKETQIKGGEMAKSADKV